MVLSRVGGCPGEVWDMRMSVVVTVLAIGVPFLVAMTAPGGDPAPAAQAVQR